MAPSVRAAGPALTLAARTVNEYILKYGLGRETMAIASNEWLERMTAFVIPQVREWALGLFSKRSELMSFCMAHGIQSDVPVAGMEE